MLLTSAAHIEVSLLPLSGLTILQAFKLEGGLQSLLAEGVTADMTPRLAHNGTHIV
jgi:hypothetical protein